MNKRVQKFQKFQKFRKFQKFQNFQKCSSFFPGPNQKVFIGAQGLKPFSLVKKVLIWQFIPQNQDGFDTWAWLNQHKFLDSLLQSIYVWWDPDLFMKRKHTTISQIFLNNHFKHLLILVGQIDFADDRISNFGADWSHTTYSKSNARSTLCRRQIIK